MKSGLQITEDVFNVLKASTELTDELTGSVFKDSIPMAFVSKECVVVGTLAATPDQLQKSVVNVNIHIPNLSEKIGGIQDSSLPNNKRFKELEEIVSGLLNRVFTDDYHLYIRQPGILFKEQGSTNHYLNIKVDYYSVIKN